MRLSIVVACALLVGISAGCDRTPSAGATPSPGGSENPGTPSAVDQVAQADAPATDRYPALLFGLLEPDERARFVSLAEAELCPCDNSVQSLDACLSESEAPCTLALHVASLMMRMIKERAGDIEVLDAVQQAVSTARRVHTFDLTTTPWKGSDAPRITLVEFADFQCPACRTQSVVLNEIIETYGGRGVRLYFKQFPLSNRPNAQRASVAALAAHRQDHFWDYHDLIFTHQTRLSSASDPTELLVGWADELGLNRDRFIQDMNDPALELQVARDRQEGIDAGIQATPTLFINGVMVNDDYSAEALAERIETLLASDE